MLPAQADRHVLEAQILDTAPFAAPPNASLNELTRVSIVRRVDADGRWLPVGATGTVVHAYADGRAYEVEFTQPFPCLVTLLRTDLHDNAAR